MNIADNDPWSLDRIRAVAGLRLGLFAVPLAWSPSIAPLFGAAFALASFPLSVLSLDTERRRGTVGIVLSVASAVSLLGRVGYSLLSACATGGLLGM
jgi:hypothetical protein